MNEKREGWTGQPCPRCQGHGVVTASNHEEIGCPSCGGTGDEYGKLKPNAVELAPHTDEWMQGDRYGRISARNTDGTLIIQLDKSKRFVTVKPDQITREFSRL